MIYSPIIIIGSGPSGSTAAYSLVEENSKVLLLDQGYTKETIITDKKKMQIYFIRNLKMKILILFYIIF